MSPHVEPRIDGDRIRLSSFQDCRNPLRQIPSQSRIDKLEIHEELFLSLADYILYRVAYLIYDAKPDIRLLKHLRMASGKPVNHQRKLSVDILSFPSIFLFIV